MRWAGGWTAVQQLVRLLDCETKARRAVVGTARSKPASKQAASTGRTDAGGLGLYSSRGTAAPKSLPGHWRRLSIALHCPHIYRHHTVTLYNAPRLVDELHSPPLPSARGPDRAASGRALLALRDTATVSSHRKQPAIAAFPTRCRAARCLWHYVLAAPRLFSLTSG